MKHMTWARAAAAALCAVLLSGCAGPGMGVASRVGKTPITDEQAADASALLCALVKTNGQAASLSMINKQALASLIDIEVTEQYARSKGLRADPQMISAVAQQGLGMADQLPAKYREDFKKMIMDISRSRVLLVEAGAKLSNQPVTLEKGQQLLQAGGVGRLQFEKSLTIDTASRFSPDEKGWPSKGNGSVSVPSSAIAKDALKLTPEQNEDPKWVASLAPSQRCGG